MLLLFGVWIQVKFRACLFRPSKKLQPQKETSGNSTYATTVSSPRIQKLPNNCKLAMGHAKNIASEQTIIVLPRQQRRHTAKDFIYTQLTPACDATTSTSQEPSPTHRRLLDFAWIRSTFRRQLFGAMQANY